MKYSKNLIPTLKETPQDAEILSHRLMLRAGLIRKLASGTYTYLPLGLKALKKAEAIVRDEMDKTGALEVLMPAIHPADLWKKTGRYEIMGDDMIHFKDRHGKANVLGPTHEEVITDLVRGEIHSYKQLPITLYQIQTKFRDEMRPRSGVIRSREFIMKDAYSFHTTAESLDETYEAMRGAYERIYTRCGLDYYLVEADPGAMGGSGSQEFVLFSNAGEDRVIQYGKSKYVVSAEMAFRKLKGLKPPESTAGGYAEKHTPNVSSVEAVGAFLKAKPHKIVKTMIYSTGDTRVDVSTGMRSDYVAVLVRGDHEVSDHKVRQQFPGAALATAEAIDDLGSAFGFSGPIGLKDLALLVDEDILEQNKIIVGANKRDTHYVGVTWADLVAEAGDRITIGDFRQAVDGDEGEHDGKDVKLHLKTAIELGHIFKLGTRYTKPLKAQVLDEKSKELPMIMGCYGIGINRIIASAIEQQSTEDGIRWPNKSIAPYEVLILTTSVTDEALMKESEAMYAAFMEAGIDVLWDDRDVSAGIKFNDADLLGIPIRIVLGPKGLKKGVAEVKDVTSDNTKEVPLAEAQSFVTRLLS